MSTHDFDDILENFRQRATARIAEFERMLAENQKEVARNIAATAKTKTQHPPAAPRVDAKASGWGNRVLQQRTAVRSVLQRPSH